MISVLIRNLIDFLNYHTSLYDKGTPEISDVEWDKKYFELQELEANTGCIYPDSPTQSINYQVVNKLEKVEHNHPMLSLPKTKDPQEAFTKYSNYITMLKMDGLTCSLTYKDGKLIKAETRGDGRVGENILHNALVVKNIPKQIHFLDEITIDGEIICRWDDFESFSNEFKNPRNFATGSIRLLDASKCATRKLSFVAWDVFGLEEDLLSERLNRISDWGFTVVPYATGNSLNYQTTIEFFQNQAKIYKYPIDGLVIKVDSDKERKVFSDTSHHLGGAIALKFYDEEATSNLINIEYEPSRTGILTPVAVFEPVELEGSIVSRASLHNISIMEKLSGGQAYLGDTLTIIKANQIIPQVIKWEHKIGDIPIDIPSTCPVCGGFAAVRTSVAESCRMLVCENPQCEGKLINQLDHFLGKKGLDIKGISKATLEKLISYNWITNKIDIFNLRQYRDEWVKKPGFGPKSVDNALNAIDQGRHTTLNKFICSLGIPEIGTSASKEICKVISTYQDFRDKVNSKWEFSNIEGFGIVMEENILDFDYSEADEIAQYLIIEEEKTPEVVDNLNGAKFVITGTLKHYKNRKLLEQDIIAHGGKVVGSISKNTNYLICNDKDSNTAKHKSAKTLNIPIITEEEFLQLLSAE